jgi:hypothetical protein
MAPGMRRLRAVMEQDKHLALTCLAVVKRHLGQCRKAADRHHRNALPLCRLPVMPARRSDEQARLPRRHPSVRDGP